MAGKNSRWHVFNIYMQQKSTVKEIQAGTTVKGKQEGNKGIQEQTAKPRPYPI